MTGSTKILLGAAAVGAAFVAMKFLSDKKTDAAVRNKVENKPDANAGLAEGAVKGLIEGVGTLFNSGSSGK